MTMPFVLSIISLCICISGFFFFRWYVARKIAAGSLLSEYRAEVYRLIAEIDAATDRDSPLVEERIKTLKKILEDTDRRIAVYIRELQRSRSAEEMYASLGRGIRAALDSNPAAGEQKHDPVASEPSAPAAPLPDIAEEKKHNAPDAAGEKRAGRKRRLLPAKSGQTSSKPKIKVQIAEMSAQGLSPPEIASRLELSLAEVDLALNLLNRPNR